jgi:hypothetical protein
MSQAGKSGMMFPRRGSNGPSRKEDRQDHTTLSKSGTVGTIIDDPWSCVPKSPQAATASPQPFAYLISYASSSAGRVPSAAPTRDPWYIRQTIQLDVFRRES